MSEDENEPRFDENDHPYTADELRRELEDEEAEIIDFEQKRQERDRAKAADEPSKDKSGNAEKPRWCIPLCEFLGDKEPDDDDSEDWVIRDIIPRGEAALFVGRAKGGKTWAMLDLGISIALGEPWIGNFENTMRGPAKVGIVALEDSERRLRKRIWELCRGRGVDVNDPRLQQNLTISRQPLRLPDKKDQRAIEQELKQFKPVAMLFDNLTRIMTGDPNKTQDASAFCTMWIRMCSDIGCSFDYLHHIKKADAPTRGGKEDPFEKIRGSGAFVDAARNIVLSMPVDDLGDRYLSEVHMRGNLDLRRQPFALEFERALVDGRQVARLRDRGDASETIGEVRKTNTEKKRAERDQKAKEEAARVYRERREKALEILHRDGKISARALAKEIGLESHRGAPTKILGDLETEGVIKRAGNDGYVIAEDK